MQCAALPRWGKPGPRPAAAWHRSPAVPGRCVAARMYKQANDMAAEREEVYLYDESELAEWEGTRPPDKLRPSELAQLRGDLANVKPLAAGMQDVYVGNRKDLPGTYIGAVEVVAAPGAGYMLRATDIIHPGDLILSCTPLCALLGPPGSPPSHEDLSAAVLKARWVAEARAAFPQMFAGSTWEAPRDPSAPGADVGVPSFAPDSSSEGGASSNSFLPPPPPSTALSPQDLVDLEAELRGQVSAEEWAEFVAGMTRTVDAQRHRVPPDLTTLVTALTRVKVEGRLGSRLPLRMDLDRVKALVRHNSLSMPHQDLTTTTLRQEQLVSATGIWPLAALVNHSCAPNTSYTFLGAPPPASTGWEAVDAAGKGPSPATASSSSGSSSSSSNGGRVEVPRRPLLAPGVGPRLLLRAATTIYPGDEVTLDYLEGEGGALLPLAARQKQLKQRWGFLCRCRRCVAEYRAGQVIGDMQYRVNTLAAQLAAATTARGQQPASQHRTSTQVSSSSSNSNSSSSDSSTVYSDLVKSQRMFDEEVNELGVPASTAAGLQAGIFQVYWQVAATKMRANPDAVQSLASVGVAMEVVKDVLPGSLLHALLACLLAEGSSDKWGMMDQRSQGALGEAIKALQLRYGPMEGPYVKQLLPVAAAWAEALLLGLPVQQVPELLGMSPGSNLTGTAEATGDWLKEEEDPYSDAAVQREFEAMLEAAAEEVVDLDEETLKQMQQEEEAAAAAERLREEQERAAALAVLAAEAERAAAGRKSGIAAAAAAAAAAASSTSRGRREEDGIPVKDMAAFLSPLEFIQASHVDRSTAVPAALGAGTAAGAGAAAEAGAASGVGPTEADTGTSTSTPGGDKSPTGLGTAGAAAPPSAPTAAAPSPAAAAAASVEQPSAAGGDSEASPMFTTWLAGEQVFADPAAGPGQGPAGLVKQPTSSPPVEGSPDTAASIMNGAQQAPAGGRSQLQVPGGNFGTTGSTSRNPAGGPNTGSSSSRDAVAARKRPLPLSGLGKTKASRGSSSSGLSGSIAPLSPAAGGTNSTTTSSSSTSRLLGRSLALGQPTAPGAATAKKQSMAEGQGPVAGGNNGEGGLQSSSNGGSDRGGAPAADSSSSSSSSSSKVTGRATSSRGGGRLSLSKMRLQQVAAKADAAAQPEVTPEAAATTAGTSHQATAKLPDSGEQDTKQPQQLPARRRGRPRKTTG